MYLIEIFQLNFLQLAVTDDRSVIHTWTLITPVLLSAVLIYDQSNCDNLRQSNTTDYITDYDSFLFFLYHWIPLVPVIW